MYPSALLGDSPVLSGFSPFVIHLPPSLLDQIKKTVYWLPPFLENQFLKENPGEKGSTSSVLTAYDFHFTKKAGLKLIEINTNASGFLFCDLIQKAHHHESGALSDLKNSFFNEWQNFKSPKKAPSYTAIVDEDIENQKMKREFFMYRDLMKTWGWKAQVLESESLKPHPEGGLMDENKNKIDFVYNRLTDFYFEKHPLLLQAYQNKKTAVSPHPQAYKVFSDKKKLGLLSKKLFDEKMSFEGASLLKKVVLKTQFLDSPEKPSMTKEEAWLKRKNLFFKPLYGFSGRGVYRGRGLTKKKMAELKNYIVQEEAPPSKWEDPFKGELWKWDLRAFSYQDQVQLVSARFYQGQVVNFSKPLSGFGRVLFKDPL